MLITSRTPLRISFFGGGTDYPEYFERHPGAVVGMAIDRYIYISALKLSSFISYKYRVSYSRLETVDSHDKILHPVVREVLREYRIEEGLDINVLSDLPANSGLGSSSAFTVGFINLITTLRGLRLSKIDLGRAAIRIEHDVLQERVGVQDQLHAAFGGMNRFDFVDARIRITPVQMTAECQTRLLQSMVLVYTGAIRNASMVLEHQIEATRESKIDRELSHLMALTTQAVGILEGSDPESMIDNFGTMLHDGWMTKRRLSPMISSPAIDALYERACTAGAVGGKLCGAGSGGFLLMVVPADNMTKFREAMQGEHLVSVGLDTQGSSILLG